MAVSPAPALTHTPLFETVSEQRSFTWKLTLPSSREPLDLDRRLGSGWKERLSGAVREFETVEEAIARARSGS